MSLAPFLCYWRRARSKENGHGQYRCWFVVDTVLTLQHCHTFVVIILAHVGRCPLYPANNHASRVVLLIFSDFLFTMFMLPAMVQCHRFTHVPFLFIYLFVYFGTALMIVMPRDCYDCFCVLSNMLCCNLLHLPQLMLPQPPQVQKRLFWIRFATSKIRTIG